MFAGHAGRDRGDRVSVPQEVQHRRASFGSQDVVQRHRNGGHASTAAILSDPLVLEFHRTSPCGIQSGSQSARDAVSVVLFLCDRRWTSYRGHVSVANVQVCCCDTFFLQTDSPLDDHQPLESRRRFTRDVGDGARTVSAYRDRSFRSTQQNRRSNKPVDRRRQRFWRHAQTQRSRNRCSFEFGE